MPKMTPVAEAAYALDFNLSRDDLRPEVQAEYDRLLQARWEAARAFGPHMSRDDLRPEVRAEYKRILQARRAREPKPTSGMTIDDAQGIVTIWHPDGAVLRADDHGVRVRTDFGTQRRVAWAEISRFEDRVGFDSEAGRHFWKLVIVRHKGRKVTAYRMYGAPPAATVTAIRQIAGRYEVPANLAGFPIFVTRAGPFHPSLRLDRWAAKQADETRWTLVALRYLGLVSCTHPGRASRTGNPAAGFRGYEVCPWCRRVLRQASTRQHVWRPLTCLQRTVDADPLRTCRGVG